ncbi:Gfo/Idh/MocA family oxidoreductase [Phycisphaerales bacterium AB-hyl4]|uniref:Gfo/Idh/MocA family oxidoreductase n=1 Tax=Natronomicrosphaera hydrolytica TaxID=3242702 RepID=A0ABV4U5Q3_9BACT
MGKLSVYNQVKNRRASDEKVSVVFDKANWPPLAQTNLSPVIDVEHHSMILMQLDNGVQASYQQCHYTPDSHRNYTIIGTEGRIENQGDYSTDSHQAEVHLWTNRGDQHETIRIPSTPGTHGGADPEVVADFLRFLKTGHTHGASPLDARMSVATGVMATQSLRAGSQPYDVPAVAHRGNAH